MIFYDGYRLGATTYHELHRFCEKLQFNPNDIISQGGRLWLHCTGWQQKAMDRTSTRYNRVTATELNQRTARISGVELKESRIAYESLMQTKGIVPKDERSIIRNGRSYTLGYRATGEKDMFLKIAKDRLVGGKLRSEISGKILIMDNNHPLWVNQFAHILPKGNYGRYRLLEENIMLMTVEEHHLQTVDPGSTYNLPEWEKFWAKHEELKMRYHAEMR